MTERTSPHRHSNPTQDQPDRIDIPGFTRTSLPWSHRTDRTGLIGSHSNKSTDLDLAEHFWTRHNTSTIPPSPGPCPPGRQLKTRRLSARLYCTAHVATPPSNLTGPLDPRRLRTDRHLEPARTSTGHYRPHRRTWPCLHQPRPLRPTYHPESHRHPTGHFDKAQQFKSRRFTLTAQDWS